MEITLLGTNRTEFSSVDQRDRTCVALTLKRRDTSWRIGGSEVHVVAVY